MFERREMAIGKTIGAFELDLARFGQAIGDDVAEARRRVAHDLFDRITRKTPVDMARASVETDSASIST